MQMCVLITFLAFRICQYYVCCVIQKSKSNVPKNNIFTLCLLFGDIYPVWIPYILTILVPKFEIVHFDVSKMVLYVWKKVTLVRRRVPSDLSLYCLQMPVFPNTHGYYGIFFSFIN